MTDRQTGRLLGIDLGMVRTGFAVSDPGGLLASPVGTVTERDLERLGRSHRPYGGGTEDRPSRIGLSAEYGRYAGGQCPPCGRICRFAASQGTRSDFLG